MMDFLESVNEQIKLLTSEESGILNEMAPLQEKLDGVRSQISHLEGYLKAFGSNSNHVSSKGEESITEKIVRVFERQKQPLHYTQILDLLESQEGFVMPGKDPKANMTAKLAGSKKFKRLERGIYILSHWENQHNLISK